MEYISAQEASEKWGITKRRVQILCASSRIEGAVRVGNMWIIPCDAEKPEDGRIKGNKHHEKTNHKTTIKAVRNRIKAISVKGMKKMLEEGLSYEEAKTSLVILFALEMILFYIRKSGGNQSFSEALHAVEKIMGQSISDKALESGVDSEICLFIEQNDLYCDDALSWCYQYANKINPEALYSGTQFFTEKYMISTLVESVDIASCGKIFDPACGGGNFLLYCMDVFVREQKHDSGSCREKDEALLRAMLSKLNGYEIDVPLAIVSSINLRLKCLSLLADWGYEISAEDFTGFVPDIFYPEKPAVGGSLDAIYANQVLIKVGDKAIYGSKEVFSDIDLIITNPPFQTVKGMPENLKNYLKKTYPESKCDMCNAFIEMTISALSEGGTAGLVTQNSWMYLDSFEMLRHKILSECRIEHIYELGSDAFYDLNGEKSNVVLLCLKKIPPACDDKVRLTSLKSLELFEKEELLTSSSDVSVYTQTVARQDILDNNGYRFDMISSSGLRKLMLYGERYEQYAVPMQGTSTGNAKELIDYYWKHIGDEDWTLVSKGGGYSRWCGLNCYSVKWGKTGEYIRETRGSAIRNAGYFGETQMVFSDTGTAGLNVRELMPGQIFVASGPGIRIKDGKTYAHLSFLNSRFAAYYIRLISPKLTVSAGYIAKIPVCSEILRSDMLEKLGRQCTEAKRHRLSKRPCNVEFSPVLTLPETGISENAYIWFREDLEDEWLQLRLEGRIDEYIFSAMNLSQEDIHVIDGFIGSRKIFDDECDKNVNSVEMADMLQKNMDSNCLLSRTKADKRSLGCDGIIEFLAQKNHVSCEHVYKKISDGQFYQGGLRKKYENLYLHALVLSALGYPQKPISMGIDALIRKIGVKSRKDIELIEKWIPDKFNRVHYEGLMKNPVFEYDPNRGAITYKEAV